MAWRATNIRQLTTSTMFKRARKAKLRGFDVNHWWLFKLRNVSREAYNRQIDVIMSVFHDDASLRLCLLAAEQGLDKSIFGRH